MPVDASIYNQVGQGAVKPLNQLEAMANAYQLQNAQLESQGKQQAYQDDQAMRQAAMASGGDVNKLYQSLLQGGNVKGAQAVQKQMLDAQKIGADIDHTKANTGKVNAETLDKALDVTRSFANQVDTPQAAAAYIKGLYGHPLLGKIAESMMPVDQALAQIPQDMNSPQGLRWKAAHVNITGKDLMGMLMPKTDSQNLGGNMSFGTIDQFSGKRTQTGLAPITETANNIANNETTRRGQNMVDARSRDANKNAQEASQSVYDADRGLVINKGTGLARPAATFDGKPVGDKEKPLTEGQSKAALFGSRMQNADAILAQLADDGTTKSVPGSNAGYGIGGVISALQPEAQQKLDQAKRDFVNAVLRRESGASISPSEFESAEKQYFPSVGESKAVRDQKANARAIAIRGMLAELPKANKGLVGEIIGTPASDGFKYLGVEK